ncbi:type II toxin-antitoxin system RelE/ParE family toxin [Rasiella sp. SM2506]|uniref:type II toxin-antitoxin system RelE/ParE family toxin n=1 Tax=Rasiella sp. SM2506 TaxID=3423914 RepID=UPI003D79D7CE
MNVYLSSLAEKKLRELLQYLLEEWSKKSRDKFLLKLTEKIDQISNQPHSCQQSTEVIGLYKCVVTKQTTFYYRIHKAANEIEIITLFDTRKDPIKLKKDVR